MTVGSFPARPLASGALSLPILGFGGAPLGGLLQANDASETEAMLQQTLEVGYRFYDTAPFYGFGRSERMTGNLLRGQDYILSTKVGRLLRPGLPDDPAAMGWPDPLPFHPVYDYSYDGIMRSYEDSRHRLGLDRIDILLVHDIGEMTHGVKNSLHFNALSASGYRALEELRRTGDVKAIGLGVNEVEICREALKIGDWDLFLLAGRYTLLEQAPLDDLFPECAAAGTSIIIGGPYNSGILVGGDTWNYDTAPADIVARVRALSDCAAKHDVPLPAAALQFPLAHPQVISVIPGLRNRSELLQTLEWAATDIPKEFWQALQAEGLMHPQAPLPDINPYQKV
ncbi:pyridoxal 4-dehydrogenase [Ruegeria sp. ANG-R]|uniref:aldo/keto reductase n=1 Tax=Ruegeria sp. ANG-R TaxID=1577903 RepID=UPI00057FC599|nr:aldo/keto reductase [Ruegeria sp. ANG-R]KIC37069.1 pyridoxal 4-dehydrogenase [Ruegeria sp. ANG-R]